MYTQPKDYWQTYYTDLAAHGQIWLDYSNPRVQLQTLSLCLEAAGDILGRGCADIGCGRGQLAMMLKALGASSVCGIDITRALVEQNRKRFSGVEWRHGDIADPAFVRTLPMFDRVFMVEVLQCVDAVETVPNIWKRVQRGGRLICMVPNQECPIIAQAVERYEGYYVGVDATSVKSLANTLEDLAVWAARGLTFRSDQRLAPYAAGEWTTDLDFPSPPNRFNVVFVKED